MVVVNEKRSVVGVYKDFDLAKQTLHKIVNATMNSNLEKLFWQGATLV